MTLQEVMADSVRQVYLEIMGGNFGVGNDIDTKKVMNRFNESIIDALRGEYSPEITVVDR